METSLIGKALNFGFNEYRFESCVSNDIIYNNCCNHLINNISFNSKNKKLTFNVFINKKTVRLLILLKKINFISNYVIFFKNKKTLITITPSYAKNLSLYLFFKFLSKPTKKY